MSDPITTPPKPRVTGYNKRNIALATGIAVAVMVALFLILSADDEGPIVDGRPRATARSTEPPTQFLRDPKPPAIPTPPPPERTFKPPPARVVNRPASPRRTPAKRKRSLAEEALRAPITFDGGRSRSAGATASTSASSDFLSSALKDLEEQGRQLSELLRGGSPPATSHAPAGEGARSRPPEAPYRIDQGTVISARLLTEINSDLPGQILAQVSRDVYDSADFDDLLIPRGTRLIGLYESDLALGQNRLVVNWSRLLFPDGSSRTLESEPGVDERGRAGLAGRVNHHTARVFGHAILLSLVSGGFSAAQPDRSDRLDSGDLALSGASRELERAASELLRRRGGTKPTIRIRAGREFHVFLTRDLAFEKPYAAR